MREHLSQYAVYSVSVVFVTSLPTRIYSKILLEGVD